MTEISHNSLLRIIGYKYVSNERGKCDKFSIKEMKQLERISSQKFKGILIENTDCSRTTSDVIMDYTLAHFLLFRSLICNSFLLIAYRRWKYRKYGRRSSRLTDTIENVSITAQMRNRRINNKQISDSNKLMPYLIRIILFSWRWWLIKVVVIKATANGRDVTYDNVILALVHRMQYWYVRGRSFHNLKDHACSCDTMCSKFF